MSSIPPFFVWAAVLIFVLHNVEEARGIAIWAEKSRSTRLVRWYKTYPFCVAVTLLSIAFLMLAAWLLWTGSHLAFRLFTFSYAAIFANAISHIANVIFTKNPLPGGWTAAFLIFPSGVWFAYYVIEKVIFSGYDLLLLLSAGAVLQVPLALVALLLAHGIIWLFYKHK
ncbi:HXXEE domain-containing protein [Agrobacterium vitis]